MLTDPRFIPREGRTLVPGASLSLNERDRRWKLARSEMKAREIDCLIIIARGYNSNGNVRWLDNGDYSERHLIFPLEGDPMNFWLLQNWGKWFTETCWEGVRYRGHEGKYSVVAVDTIKDLGYEGGKIGIVGLIGAGYAAEGSIPYMTFQNLKSLLPKAKFVDATNILTKARMIKSKEEIAMIEKASELANMEINTALKMLKPGIRERDIMVEMDYVSMKAGAEFGRDHWTLLNSGEGYPVNHRDTNKIIQNGEILQLGHYTRFAGYWSHPHVAISLGSMNAEAKGLRDAVLEGTTIALELLKPGVEWSKVNKLVDEPILSRGYYHEVPQIHGTGLDGIEPPVTDVCAGNIPNQYEWREKSLEGSIENNTEWKTIAEESKTSKGELLVEEGMSLALEVKAALEDRIAICFGPQIIVEKDGPRILNPDAMDVIEL